MDTVLDADLARRADGDPARDPRLRQGRRRDRGARVRPHHLSAARQPLPDLHAALDDFPARRLQRRHVHLRRRPRELDARAGDARHPRRLRDRSSAPRRGGRDDGAAVGDPASDRPDAQAPHRGGAAMSTIAAEARLSSRAVSRAHSAVRRRRYLNNAGTLVLSVMLVVWSIAPIYNMVLISLEPEGDVFTDHIWPRVPSGESFWGVLTQGHWYLEHFWHQFANSFFIGAMVTFFALLFGSLTSFAIGRMRLRHGWLVSNAALLTYVIPASFLAIPFYRIMQMYGLSNNLWAIIAAEVTFATPYAIFIFQQYARSIPIELDEAARIDGASPIQVYLRIYLPLMAPALVAVGTYALLLAWNEYLYQFLLLSSKRSMTVPVALAQFLNSDEAPWNYMMATAIVYALPPVAIYYAFRRSMAAGLTMGGVKG